MSVDADPTKARPTAARPTGPRPTEAQATTSADIAPTEPDAVEAEPRDHEATRGAGTVRAARAERRSDPEGIDELRFEAGGVDFRLVAAELSGPLRPGRAWPRTVLRFLFLGTPAIVLPGLLLVVPTAVTAWWALQALPDLFSSSMHLGPGVGWTYLRTGLAIVFACLLVLLGFTFARFSRKVERLWKWCWGLMVLPFAISPLVSGVAFRIIFDSEPERGTVSALFALFGRHPDLLWEGWIWVLLASAFAWTWLGFIISLFRAALEAADRNAPEQYRAQQENPESRNPAASQALAKQGAPANDRTQESPGEPSVAGAAAYLRELGGRARAAVARFRKDLRPCRHVALVIGLTLTVAAARVFDLLLIAVPGSVQYGVDVVGVRWWRLTESAIDRGQVALYVFPVVVMMCAAVPVFAHQWLRRGRHPGMAVRPRPPRDIVIGPAASPLHTIVGAAIALFVAMPLIVLIATAFHSPEHAATTHWFTPERPSVENFVQATNAGLVRSLGTTAAIAASATLLLVGAALPAAYWLAARPEAPLRRIVVPVLVALAVMPVQAYMAPLRAVSDQVRLGTGALSLTLIHAAAGLPIAVLILRNALYSQEGTSEHDVLFGLASAQKTARRIWDQAGPALIAVMVLEFVQVWNDFIISFMIRGPGGSPLTLVLWGEARQFAISTGSVAASAVVSAVLPVALVLLTWRRFLVPGITGGVLR